jgi:hypothetical protein
LIAADVNGSGSLTTLDLVETRSVVLHNKGEKFRGKNSVEFIDETSVNEENIFEYKNYLDIIPTISHLNLDFTAVKRGDASRSWNPNKNKGGREQMADEMEIVFGIGIQSENQVNIPLQAKDFYQMIGLQFTMEWDPTVYQFEGLNDVQLHFDTNVQLAKDGKLTVVWSTDQLAGVTLEDQSVLAGLGFRKLNDGDPKISISSEITPALAFNSRLESLSVINSEFDHELKNLVISVYPNPATEYLLISGLNPSGGNEYILINTIGEWVKSGELSKESTISIGELTPGLYILKVTDSLGKVFTNEIIKL